MFARAVIGASFGDEGKGLVTDYLCAQGAGMVVRFNGGAQAGHTVVAPDGRRHVFAHFGSGTLAGVSTFLSPFFVCNPIAFFRERKVLADIGVSPTVYAHPDCLITTFADMMINQTLENRRAGKRHGSCGLGVNETIERSQVPELKITMSDLWNGISTLEARVATICKDYAAFRTGAPLNEPAMIEAFLQGCWAFADAVHPLGIAQCKEPVFEGAQGLLLDQHNKEFFPHLTRSNTGIRNVRELCQKAGIDKIEPYYVSRTYLTRHGAGPLPGEDAKLRYDDDTNVENQWQQKLRFAPLDVKALRARCAADWGGTDYKLVLTHCDQRPAPCVADLYSDGPTRNDVQEAAYERRVAVY
jgi:adenylosuccinate synthase